MAIIIYYPMTSLGIMNWTCPMMQESKPYCACCLLQLYKSLFFFFFYAMYLFRSLCLRVRVLTKIKNMKANSNEFWKRMKWIKKRTSRGLLNQNKSSDGRTTKSPSTATCFSATSWAKSVMICSNFVPTASKSCGENRVKRTNQGWFEAETWRKLFRDLRSKE